MGWDGMGKCALCTCAVYTAPMVSVKRHTKPKQNKKHSAVNHKQLTDLALKVGNNLGDSVSVSLHTDRSQHSRDGFGVRGIVAAETEEEVCSKVAHLVEEEKKRGKRILCRKEFNLAD